MKDYPYISRNGKKIFESKQYKLGQSNELKRYSKKSQTN